jgi:protein involved in sex pheromone biosynthesis
MEDTIIDVTSYYCNLAQLADSVSPGKMLINTVAEIAIHIMTLENKNPKKYIMPLHVAAYRRSKKCCYSPSIHIFFFIFFKWMYKHMMVPYILSL